VAIHATGAGDVWLLPDAPWARRVSGTFANRLALLEPTRAHAVLTPLADGDYMVSVRSAKARGPTAVDFCREFKGGGRTTAAGIDRLDAERLDSLHRFFRHCLGGRMRILVIHGSFDGQARRIAERIAQVMERGRHEVRTGRRAGGPGRSRDRLVRCRRGRRGDPLRPAHAGVGEPRS
jgi:hypothetical protein